VGTITCCDACSTADPASTFLEPQYSDCVLRLLLTRESGTLEVGFEKELRTSMPSALIGDILQPVAANHRHSRSFSSHSFKHCIHG